MKVKRRQVRRSRDVLEAKRLRNVPLNVVEGAVDLGSVVSAKMIVVEGQGRRQVSSGASIIRLPQDLARRQLGAAAPYSIYLPYPTTTTPMELGAFSVSLAVKDIALSRAFYEKLGFTVEGGAQEQNWLVMRHGTTTIGLFQGMFDRNLLTFNPGWGPRAQPVETFDDVRALQAHFEEQGLELEVRADSTSDGPAHLSLSDPDGNPILVDQHVPKPK